VYKITGGAIGLIEVLSSTVLCGMVFAVIGGQALVIVGITAGPVVIFTTSVYTLDEKFKIPFLQWCCVIGFIGGFFSIFCLPFLMCLSW
jgi:hypothetical protein